jgi:hypothetical protein
MNEDEAPKRTLNERVEQLRQQIAAIKKAGQFNLTGKIVAAEEALSNAFFLIEEMAERIQKLEEVEYGK